MDTMNNIHPIYNIKILMTKRELMKDPALQNESWDRFLPKFKKKNVQTKKPKKQVVKRKYTPFPPPQQPSKVDLQLESGEYFMKEHEKKQKKQDQKEQAQQQKTAQKKKEKEAVFAAPKEEILHDEKTQESSNVSVDIEALKRKLKSKNLNKSTTSVSHEKLENNFIETVAKVSKKKKKSKSESIGIPPTDSMISDLTPTVVKKKKKKLTSDNVSDANSEKNLDEGAVSSRKKRKKSKGEAIATENTELDTSSPKKKKKVKKEKS